MGQSTLNQQGVALAELPRGLLIAGDGVPLTSEPLRSSNELMRKQGLQNSLD